VSGGDHWRLDSSTQKPQGFDTKAPGVRQSEETDLKSPPLRPCQSSLVLRTGVCAGAAVSASPRCCSAHSKAPELNPPAPCSLLPHLALAKHPSAKARYHEEDHEGGRRDREVVVRETPTFRKSEWAPSAHFMALCEVPTQTHLEGSCLSTPGHCNGARRHPPLSRIRDGTDGFAARGSLQACHPYTAYGAWPETWTLGRKYSQLLLYPSVSNPARAATAPRGLL
jgi:hypothetical protein